MLIGKIEPILYDELCVMAQWLIENSDSLESAESTTQTYQMWIGLGSETIFFQQKRREPDLDAFGEIRQAIVYQALGRVKTLLTGKDTKQTLQKTSLDNN